MEVEALIRPFALPDPALVADFRTRWETALDAFYDHVAPPWWIPDLVITPDLRRHYQDFLPIEELLDDLTWLLGHWLPGPGWLPWDVRQRAYASLPDLWRTLPAHLAGRLDWTIADLLPLACGLASPYRFGSQASRYPEQEALLGQAHLPPEPWVMDMGCGTGQGTVQLAVWLAASGKQPRILGATREPLEGWMARTRQLSHEPEPSAAWAYPPTPPGARFAWLAADIHHFSLAKPVDLLVCNGLIGGPALDEGLAALAAQLSGQVKPGGYLMIGNRFHEGYRDRQREFVAHTASRFAKVAAIGASCLLRRLPA